MLKLRNPVQPTKLDSLAEMTSLVNAARQRASDFHAVSDYLTHDDIEAQLYNYQQSPNQLRKRNLILAACLESEWCPDCLKQHCTCGSVDDAFAQRMRGTHDLPALL